MRWYKVLDYSQKFFNFLYPFFKETEILQDFNPWNTHFRIVNGVRGSNKVSPFEISRDEERKWRILFVILWEKRNARVSNIYIYIYAYEWKFSSFHADSLQCVAALHQSRWVHILQPILLSLVPVISLPLSDVAETLGKDVPPPSPRTPSTSFVYTRLRIRNAASYPCRGSTHRRLSLSFSLFLLFCHARCAYTRSFFNDRINRGGAAIGDSFLPGTIAAMNDRACLPSIPPRMPFRIFVSIRSSQAAKWMRSSR